MSLTSPEGKIVLVNDFGSPVRFDIQPDGQIREGKNLAKQIVTRGLVGYWKLNESASSSGANTTGWWRDTAWESGSVEGGMNHGDKTGTTSNAYMGLGNQGLRFSGDDWIEVPHSTNQNSLEFTIDYWCKCDSSTFSPFVSKGDGSTNNDFEFGINTGNGTIQAFLNTVASQAVISGNIIAANVLSHIVYTQSATTGKLYLNGKFVTSASATRTVFTTAYKLYIGRRNTSTISAGYLSDVKLYNVELTANEVMQNYKCGIPTIPTRGLTCWWKLDEIASSTYFYDRAYELTGVGQIDTTNTIMQLGSSLSGNIEGPTGGQSAITFNGSSSYLSTQGTNADVCLYPGTEFSYSFWLNRAQIGTLQTMLEFGNASTTGYNIRIDSSNKILFYVFTSAPDSVTANTAHPASTWTHYVVTWKKDTAIKVYMNGVLDATGSTPTGTPGTPTGKVYLGRNTAGSSFFTGSLDEFTFYNKELTAAEVRNLFLAYR